MSVCQPAQPTRFNWHYSRPAAQPTRPNHFAISNNITTSKEKWRHEEPNQYYLISLQSTLWDLIIANYLHISTRHLSHICNYGATFTQQTTHLAWWYQKSSSNLCAHWWWIANLNAPIENKHHYILCRWVPWLRVYNKKEARIKRINYKICFKNKLKASKPP